MIFFWFLKTSVDYNGERAAAFTCLRHFSRSLEMSRPRFEKPYAQNAKENTLQCQDPNDINAGREYYKENHIERRERELMRSNSERDKHIGVQPQKKRNCSSMDREFPSCVTRGEVIFKLALIIYIFKHFFFFLLLDKQSGDFHIVSTNP